jgi:hypothetical protein
MSSPRTETTPRPDDADQPKRTQLSAVQIAAGALATVSSAVVASFLGVAGTLVGAALASVISTICATLYSESLKKTNERLRAVRQQRAGGRPAAAPAQAERRAVTRALPSGLDPRRSPSPGRRPRWVRGAVYAAAVFGLAMVIVTGVELIGQRPVSALVGNSSSSGTTTIGSLTNTSSSRDTTPTAPSSTTPAPSTAQDPGPTSAPDPDDADTDVPAGTDTDVPTGTGATSSSTSTPSTTSSAEPTRPTTQAPQQSGDEPATEAEPTP